MPTVSIAFQTNKRAQAYIDLAKHVDQYAFDAVSVYCDAPYHTSYGPLLLMAPHITRARLGCAAISPARMAPIDIAADAALLADYAQAGTYLGIARGAWLDDYGISEPSKPIQASAKPSPSCVPCGAANRRAMTGRSIGWPRMSKQITRCPANPYPS